MNHHARTLLVVATTTATLFAVPGVAHAAGTTRSTVTTPTPATTASTKATTVTTKPASSPKTTATTKRANATTTTAPVVTTSMPAGPVVYRVQAGAATNTTTARKLAAIAIAADKPAGFIITASKARTITTYRIVSGCRSLADATAIKTTLNAQHIAALVYRSQRC